MGARNTWSSCSHHHFVPDGTKQAWARRPADSAGIWHLYGRERLVSVGRCVRPTARRADELSERLLAMLRRAITDTRSSLPQGSRWFSTLVRWGHANVTGGRCGVEPGAQAWYRPGSAGRCTATGDAPMIACLDISRVIYCTDPQPSSSAAGYSSAAPVVCGEAVPINTISVRPQVSRARSGSALDRRLSPRVRVS